MSRILFFLFLFPVFQFTTYSQTEKQIKGSGNKPKFVVKEDSLYVRQVTGSTCSRSILDQYHNWEMLDSVQIRVLEHPPRGFKWKEIVVERTLSDKHGMFVLNSLQYGKSYSLEFTKEGFYFRSVNVSLDEIPDSIKQKKYLTTLGSGIILPLFKELEGEKHVIPFYYTNMSLSTKDINSNIERKFALVAENNIMSKSSQEKENEIIAKLIKKYSGFKDEKIKDYNLRLINEQLEKKAKEKELELAAQTQQLQALKLSSQSSELELSKAKERERSKELALSTKEKELKDGEIKQQKFQRNGLIFGFSLMFVLAGVTYRNFRRKKKDNVIIAAQKKTVEEQKEIVEQKNQEIIDSINYALRIQTAILPSKKTIQSVLPDSFFLYKPKDIVAGDFYWMEEIGDLVLFAACDCTGHGVPGAMVSVVCHTALNKAVIESGITKPSLILDKTSELVYDCFSKNEMEIQDGMDISLCAFNKKTNTLEWAGAYNPIWLLKNKEITETKANKQSIGGSRTINTFTNHSFQLEKGDTIYIFTDGFADQFGGEGEKKLTRKGFREVLLSLKDEPIAEQGELLDNFITSYRKETEQTDDILVIGVTV